MMRSHLREIIATTLKNHPSECIFEENALEKILDEVESKSSLDTPPGEYLDIMVDAVKNHEIYCPHEGIDRR